MANRFGGALAARPLQFIWIADCSGSMAGKKIEALNFGIREAIQPMREVADENPNAKVMVRAIKFSDGAQWHVSQPTDIHDFKWSDLTADATTDMGTALKLVAEALKTENMPERGLPPVLVLLSDGQPTDDFNSGLKALMDQPWGSKAVRIAIAIGDDADVACSWETAKCWSSTNHQTSKTRRSELSKSLARCHGTNRSSRMRPHRSAATMPNAASAYGCKSSRLSLRH